MAEFGRPRPSEDLRSLAAEHRHLAEHLESFNERTGEYPTLLEEPTPEYESRRPNVLYPAREPIFVHVHGDRGVDTTYYCVEPTLDGDDERLYDDIRSRILDRSVTRPAPSTEAEFTDHLDDLLADVVRIEDGDGAAGPLDRLRERILGDRFAVDAETYARIRYRLQRDIVGLGPLEPLMEDGANEDIHVIGPDGIFVDHGVYGMLETTASFGSEDAFENWLKNMGERMNSPISDSRPIVDATLPNGSRINVIYSDDVSIKGPSLTIRQGEETPLSILQITKWGTLSPELAAYLWLCMENEQTVFVVGETASGKTTTLNAMFSFIPRDAKIYTAEDTAEVMPPHDTWQQLLTREGQGDGGSDVDMFDLVAAALRAPYTPLWPYAAWMPWVPVLVMPGVFILAVEGLRTPNPFSLTAAGTRLDGRPCGLLRVVRHPLPWALALWGLAHVAANPDLRAVLVFGLLALFSIAGRAPLAARRRRALGEAGWAAADAAARQCPGPVVRPGSVAAGLAAYAAGLALHPWLFGVAPLAAL